MYIYHPTHVVTIKNTVTMHEGLTVLKILFLRDYFILMNNQFNNHYKFFFLLTSVSGMVPCISSSSILYKLSL